MGILEMMARRAEINEQAQQMAAIEAEGGVLTIEQVQQFADLQAEFNDLTAKIDRAKVTEKMTMATAQQITTDANQPKQNSVPAEPRQETEPRPHRLGRLIAAIHEYRGVHSAFAAPYAAERYGEDIGSVLANNTATGGAVLIPQNLGDEIIELLRPHAVVRQLGAVPINLPNGNLNLGRNKKGVLGNYVTQVGHKDTDRIKVDTPEFDSISLQTKTFAGLIPINNDFLRNAQSPAMQSMIQNDTAIGMANQEDAQFIRGGDAGGIAPKGMLNWALPGNKITAAALPTTGAADVAEYLRLTLNMLVLKLENANSQLRSPGFILAPRTKRFLMSVVDGNGNVVFPEMQQGMLIGFPFRDTTQVPINLGAGTNESEIYFADFGDLYIGEDGGMEFSVSTEASYYDENGDLINAYQNNQTLIRVIMRHDFAPRHVENIAVLTGVKWWAV